MKKKEKEKKSEDDGSHSVARLKGLVWLLFDRDVN